MIKLLTTAALMISSIAMAQMPQVPQMPANVPASGAPSAVNDDVNGPAKGAIEKGAMSAQSKSLVQQATQKALVHINTATPEELAKLPGIGPVRAKAIVDGRPYNKIEDLKNIKGIKEAVFAKIKPMIAL